jgi:hypothetical protein
MRIHFFSRLALLLIAGFGVVASQVGTGDTLEWLFVVGGILMLLGAAIDAESIGQRALDGLIALLGVWSVVQAIVFDGNDLKWFSFATAAALAVFSAIGLVMHEQELEVGITPQDRTAPLAR